MKKEQLPKKEPCLSKDRLRWCCNKKNGITLVEPNDNLSKQYLKEADQTLESLGSVKGKWSLIMGYYACYNALYCILMKSGIKSEIHECSIELMGIIKGFSEEDIELIKSLKKDRIDAQYYLKDKELKDEDKVKDFVLKCKKIIDELDVDAVRGELMRVKGGEN